MPSISISDKFFKKERDTNYSDWVSANWRELFQNSTDAGATRIDIHLAPASNGIVNLTFTDNGPGMSREVLNDVYFSIGDSTKDNDPTKIGGMGRARILTCFAMDSYRILSQDYEVVGKGGHYDVLDHSWTNGCILNIAVDDTDFETMQLALERFLYESKIPARIFFNGDLWVHKSANTGKHIRDLEVDGVSFAKVFVNKSANTNRVIVRVNGVSMASSNTNAKAQVVVELEPSMSRKVLTANRDGLRWQYRESLDRFIQELAVDTNSALRSRFGRKTVVARGGGMKSLTVQKKHTKSNTVQIVPETFKAAAYYDTRVASPRPVCEDEVTIVESTHNEFDTWLNQTFGDIFIYDETESSTIGKVISAYQPENWKLVETVVGGSIKSHRKGGRAIRVLLLWHTAIRYALEVSLAAMNLSQISFAVGFSFPNDDQRANHREQDGGHIFCLCPVDALGHAAYSITERDDIKRMMAYAKHEVTHVAVSWHGEEFSTLRETIDIAFDEAECFRRMKEAIKTAKL